MGSLLHDPVADARDIQVPGPAGGFGDVHPTRWRRAICPLLQFAPEVGEEARDAPFFDGLNGFTIDSGGPTVSSNSLPGALQDATIAHLVVERMNRRVGLALAARYSARWSCRVRARALARAVWLASSAFTRSYLRQVAWTRQGAFPRATLCCRRRHQYHMLPSDCLSAGTPFRLATYRRPRSGSCVTTGRRRLSPVLTPALSPFRAPYAERFVGAAFPGASHRPWPSLSFARLGSSLVPLAGACPVDAAGFT